MIIGWVARLLTRTKSDDHITPGLSPSYMHDLLVPYEPVHILRSSDRRLKSYPETRLKTKVDRVFAVMAPRLWNDLPKKIRLADSVASFKSLLKTYVLIGEPILIFI